MTAAEVSQLVTQLTFVASALTILVFILLYQTLAKWEKSALGRHIMFFAVATFLVLLQSIILSIWPNYWGKLIFRPGVYIGFWLVWVWRTKIFLHEQKQVRLARAARQLHQIAQDSKEGER